MYHYYMFCKPFGCVTARRDARYPTVMDYFSNLQNASLSPVGRLDRETEGLLFVTDDGKWNNYIARPDFLHEKRYCFTAMGELDAGKIAKLEEGVLLRGSEIPTSRSKINVTGTSELGLVLPLLHPEIQHKFGHNPPGRTVTFGEITITEGRNRQIRRMLQAVGCCTLALKRVEMAGILLDETLRPGEWKEMDPVAFRRMLPYTE